MSIDSKELLKGETPRLTVWGWINLTAFGVEYAMQTQSLGPMSKFNFGYYFSITPRAL